MQNSDTPAIIYLVVIQYENSTSRSMDDAADKVGQRKRSRRAEDEWAHHQFHSSSLCSRVCALDAFTAGDRESGKSTLPSPCVPSSSSKSDVDACACAAAGAGAGVGDVESGESVAANGFDEIDTEPADAGPGEESAESSDCETSESSTDARF